MSNYNEEGNEANLSNQELPIVVIDIGDGDRKYIKIFPDSKPEELAYQFCAHNNLNYEWLKEITEHLRETINSLDNERTRLNSASSGNQRVPEEVEELKQNKDDHMIFNGSDGENANSNISDFQIDNRKFISNGKKSPNKSAQSTSGNIKKDPLYTTSNSRRNTEYQKGNRGNKTRHSYLAQTLSSKSKSRLNQSSQNFNTNTLLGNKTNCSSSTNMRRSSKNPYYSMEGEILNYGERLYHKGLKLQEKRDQKLQEIKKKIEEENNKNNTFTPKINRISYNALSKRYTNKLSYNDEDNIINYKTFKQSKVDELRQKYNVDESFSFQPKIDKQSVLMDKNNESQAPRYEKLYALCKKNQINLKNLEEKIYNKYTFQPKIIHYPCPTLSIPFRERNDCDIRKRADRQEELKKMYRKLTDSVTGQKLFSPEIKDYGIQRPENWDIFTNLYNDAKKTNEKKNEMRSEIERKEMEKRNQSYFSEMSKVKINKVNERFFKKIFSILDKNKNGKINKYNLNVNGLPEKLIKIYYPIFEELREENEDLDSEQFVSASNHLLNLLSFSDRMAFNELAQEKKVPKDYNLNFTFKPKINSYSNMASRRVTTIPPSEPPLSKEEEFFTKENQQNKATGSFPVVVNHEEES